MITDPAPTQGEPGAAQETWANDDVLGTSQVAQASDPMPAPDTSMPPADVTMTSNDLTSTFGSDPSSDDTFAVHPDHIVADAPDAMGDDYQQFGGTDDTGSTTDDSDSDSY